ncbi:MAG: hypothetical protein M0D54_05660 [Hyphomonadaceae bacterium JAD_PAG50586_4]|nr:MAG: hypothetical protein M0D54_05660 [Hyphomonadaceae bacterium JAD_PAG50586_4]
MRKFTHTAFAALGGALLATPVSAQGLRPGDVARVPPGAQVQQARPRVVERRYMVMPVSIYANDETGADWAGSDEVYAIFRDPSTNAAVRTQTFGNVDTDHTRYFSQAQACLAPLGATQSDNEGKVIAWQCRAGGMRAPFAFRVELYESDGSGGVRSLVDWAACLGAAPGEVQRACLDDLIGAADVTLRPMHLGACGAR